MRKKLEIFPRGRPLISGNENSFFQDDRQGARPAIPPSVGAGAAPGIFFSGERTPSDDFQSVRDQRRTTPLWFLVDLSIARSIAAGTAALLALQGNTLYADPLQDSTGANIAGYATVHFADTSLSPQGTPITVGPQFIAKIPFTQLLLENIAQPGKFLRIIYGVDIDFSPGLNASVTISSIVQMRSAGQNYTTSYKSTANLGAGGNEQVFAPGTNVNGVIAHRAQFLTNSAAIQRGTYLAKTGAAPATIIDGDAILQNDFVKDVAAAFATFDTYGKLEQPILIPTGKGLWFFSLVNEAGGALRSALLSIL